MKTKEKKIRSVSSQTFLIRVLVNRLAMFGWENTEIDWYHGRTTFRHRDGGTPIEFSSVRELSKFEREASHRKTY